MYGLCQMANDLYFLRSIILATECDMLYGKMSLSVASIIKRRKYVDNFLLNKLYKLHVMTSQVKWSIVCVLT